MSQSVLWEVVKGNNGHFLVKRNGLTLSTDPFNNTGVQTYSSTGFITQNAIGVVPTQAKANQINNVNLVARKSTKFQQADRKTKNTQSVYASTLSVKHGIHISLKSNQKEIRHKKTRIVEGSSQKIGQVEQSQCCQKKK
ncbi:unnamed protein product (macronuclear) [Paramecium tetraurelia]|uniref:Ribosomal eL28/Mak16 domain-containing protein n=1 Tax=Paramecium tetraurelia TaxID=5888 RepID=A0CBW8_PARTE|nr:uncharacterized protein GSPATT00037068001 [Paramecium tetraurelia]CAK68285.1 unnamed protein product [Paramecium tetraurelia]|eukprot:XP_001435682.1 hypothetical protein (macronuclear) [Paramecium tetraurelia strain d4-2]